MSQRGDGEFFGKLLFAATLLAVLVFFWWLLIYGHGVVAVE